MTDTPPTAIGSRHVAKGVGTTFLARLGTVVDVIAQPLYVTMFGLSGYGLYAVLWAAVNLVENVADLGMTSALQRTVPQAANEAEAVASLRAALLLAVVPCIVIAAIISLFAPHFAHFFNVAAKDQDNLVHAIRLFVWALPLWGFVETATSAVRSRRAFGAEIRLRLVWEQMIRLLLAVGFYLASFGTMSLFYAHLISLTLICGLSVRLLARYFDLSLLSAADPDRRIFSDTLKAGLAVLPTNVVARLFSDGTPIILNAILPGAAGAVAAGLYAIIRKISSIVQLVRGAFGYVLAPLASAASMGHADEVREIYGFATRVSLALALPLGLVMIAGGPIILSVFGHEAQMALPALAILITSRMFEAVTGSAAPIQQVMSSYLSQLAPSFLGLTVAVLLGFALMPEGQLTGMALAVAAGLTVTSVTPLIQLWVSNRLNPFESPFFRALFISSTVALAGFAVAALSSLLPPYAEWPILVLTLLASIWVSLRYALPHHDRAALGKTGRALRLL